MHTKKVFVLKNFKSPYIEQAIFILREDAVEGTATFHAVEEAERIVEAYLADDSKTQSHEKKRFCFSPKLLASLFAIGILGFFLVKII